MHTVPKNTGRWLLVLSYVSFIGAGVWATIYTSQLLESAGVGKLVQYLWATFLILGGLGSLLSVVRGLWFGEYTGLILMATGFGVYGAAAGLTSGGSPGRLALACMFMGITGLILWRWRLVQVVMQQRRKEANKNGGE